MHVNVYFLDALVSIAAVVSSALAWMQAKRRSSMKETVETAVRNTIDEKIDPIDRRVAIVETKMDLFWQRVTMDLAQVLHHPEPSRFRVDALLDKLKEEIITPAEADELRRNLEIIKNWEEGQDAPFKIYPGEQVAAAILLHTMEHVVGED